MRERTWTVLVLASTLLLGAAAVGINYEADVFGVYRDPVGRKLSVYSNANARTTKFLFSMNYIPSNFDGLLLGSSITENWDTALIEGARVYNASLTGANASEELLVARNVFARRRLRLAIVTVFPYETTSHGRKTNAMVPGEYWAGLGSVALLRAYVFLAAAHIFRRPPENDASGVGTWTPTFVARTTGAAPMKEPVGVDPEGLADFTSLVREAHAHAERVVALIPPYSWPIWEGQGGVLNCYNRLALRAFQPGDTVVDFNRARYESFQRDLANYPDGAHVSSPATRYLVEEISRELASGQPTTVRDYLAAADCSAAPP